MEPSPAMDVVCFGELLWDFYEADAKVEKESIARTFRRELGGGTANVAVVLARLGFKVAAVGGVGDDKLGETLRQTLAAEGLDVSGVVRLPTRTGITIVTLDANGAPTFSPYRVGTADVSLDEASVPAAAAKAKWAVVTSSSMLPSIRKTTTSFLAAVEKNKTALCVDLNARAHLWPDVDSLREACAELAGKATVIKCSERDLAALAGKRGMTWLEEHAKQATWVLTRTENGAAAVGKHGQATAPTKRVRVRDQTGAGDAFVSGVLAVLLKEKAVPGGKGWDDPKLWTRALEVGHLLSAKAISSVGATTGLAQVDDVMSRIVGTKK